ncbi:MAG: glycosyl hydrolase 43 family protein [Akkermansiaceae bacterium]|nr:glycosyl hydrolase 43 family protein [Akkermansiaceae bacterium]
MKQTGHPYPWVPDQGDGFYRNPVLHADYSDPDVIRVGQDFFLIASSFQCTPGLPVLHSRDLVNWRIINHALKNLPDPRYKDVQPGHGVWAPAIRFHDGKFWIIFPTPDEGIYMIQTTDPWGEWSEPYMLLEGKGLIDPCPFWDDDGTAWLAHAYAGSRAGIRNKLRIRPMSPDCTTILGEGKVVVEIDQELPALEGPKMHKRNGWYYISAPAGGVATGWQTVFRSRDIYGPYEERVVLAQRGTAVNGPHQGALLDTTSGDWWFLHFQDKDLYGRIVHLQPVRWEDDWPVVGEGHDAAMVGRPVSVFQKPLQAPGTPAVPQDSDEFEGPELGLQWQWHANHGDDWHSLSERPGFLRLRARPLRSDNLCDAPHLLLQKFPASEFSVETHIEIPGGQSGTRAGLVVAGETCVALEARNESGIYHLRLDDAGQPLGEFRIPAESVTLQLRVAEGGNCQLGVTVADKDFYQIGPAFRATPGRWIGAKVGLYCTSSDGSGHADFAWFRFKPLHRSGDSRRKRLNGHEPIPHPKVPSPDDPARTATR